MDDTPGWKGLEKAGSAGSSPPEDRSDRSLPPAGNPGDPSPPPRAAGGGTGADLRRFFTRGEGVSPLERRLLTQADSGMEAELGTLRREVEGLRRLLQISRELSSILDLDELLEAVLDSAILLTGADRGLLLLNEEGKLATVLGRGKERDSLDPRSSLASETLARRSLEENRVIPFDNISELPELREVRSIRSLDLFAAVCVPLRERGAPFGVLYLDSTTAGLRTEALEVSLLEAFASQASVALLNARLLKRLEESRLILTRENEGLRAQAQSEWSMGRILGRSAAMQALFDKIRLLKDSGIPVLLLGESGTGKELVASALHYEGLHKEGPFVPVNCAGLPGELLDSLMFGHRKGAFTGAAQDTPGLVEQAEGGTLFLDEVGDMPLTLQVKLLRFLESGEFRRVGEGEIRRAKVRLISATNQNLTRMVREKTFREDLYFRIAGIRLAIPSLRERRDDIPLLTDAFLELAVALTSRKVAGITERARAWLLRQTWPGNVRQLRHAIEGACALVPDGGLLDEIHLRMHLPGMALGVSTESVRNDSSGSLKEALEKAERDIIAAALQENGWNVSRTATFLGLSRQHMHNRIRRFELNRPEMM